jgi:hypothetical protein
MLLLLAALPLPLHAASVTAAWDPEADPHVTGYRVHYGLASRTYTVHLDAGNAVARTIDALDACKTYYLAVTAYNDFGEEGGYSDEVSFATACAGQETIATPAAPQGPARGSVGVAYAYTAAGAVSSTGDPVQYRFSWADGSVTDWLPAGVTSASKSWGAPGTYSAVTVAARCALHTSVLSQVSPALSVAIAGASTETVGSPSPPSGPTSGTVGVLYTYGTGGAVSSTGDPVQYRFSWADGTTSDWLPAAAATAAKAWGAPGTYALVRSEARCALHQEVLAAPSAPITVTITGSQGETLSPPAVLSGPSEGVTVTDYLFTAGDAVSDEGHPVMYRFQWGDGTISGWIPPDKPAEDRKSWNIPAAYLVRAEAACTTHPAVDALSAGFEVAITQNPALLFLDDFDDATATGDPQWQTVVGRWVGADGALVAAPARPDNRAVVRALPGFRAGRIDTKFILSLGGTAVPNVGVVFAHRDATHYRYVTAYSTRLVIGQVGDTKAVRGGVKRSVLRKVPLYAWHKLSVEVRPDGMVRVFLDDAPTPALTYRFGDVVPGMVGYQARSSKAACDEMRVWDETVLP